MLIRLSGQVLIKTVYLKAMLNWGKQYQQY